MRKVAFFAALLAVSCVKKTEPAPYKDFTDKLINLVIEGRDYEFAALPDLYTAPVRRIPDLDADPSVLVERLQDRGFKTLGSREINMQLSGRRIHDYVLVKDDCECEVQKIYFFTQNVSEFLVSEQMRCTKANR